MGRRVTLKDIAAEVGLSPTAVSLVLNDRPCRVSEEKRKRIREVARARHYVPNQIARSLVSQQSHTFGLVIPNIESRFFSSLAHRLEVRCRRAGYAVFITNSDDAATNDAELASQLITRGIDGLFLVAGDELRPTESLLEALRTTPVPYIMVDRCVEGLTGDRVAFDHEQGGYLATRYLIERGHSRIACVANVERSNTGRARHAGYKRALAEAGIELDPGLVLQSDYSIVGGYNATERLLQTDATAAFASSDNIALGLLKRLREEGVSVPDDLSVVSYDNSNADMLFETKLTSVAQDVDLLAERALSVMLERLGPGMADPVVELLNPAIVEGTSVQAA